MIPIGVFHSFVDDPQIVLVGTASYKSSATSTTHSIPVHADTADGDFVVLLISTDSATVTVPSGFMSYGTKLGTGIRQTILAGQVANNSAISVTISSSAGLTAISFSYLNANAIIETAATAVLVPSGNTNTPASLWVPGGIEYSSILAYSVNHSSYVSAYSTDNEGSVTVQGGAYGSNNVESACACWFNRQKNENSFGAFTLLGSDPYIAARSLAVYDQAFIRPILDDTQNVNSNYWTPTGSVSASGGNLNFIGATGASCAYITARVPVHLTGITTVTFSWVPGQVYVSAWARPYVAVVPLEPTRSADGYKVPSGYPMLKFGKQNIDTSTQRKRIAAGMAGTYQAITGTEITGAWDEGNAYTIWLEINMTARTISVSIDEIEVITDQAFTYTPVGAQYLEFSNATYGTNTEGFGMIYVSHAP